MKYNPIEIPYRPAPSILEVSGRGRIGLNKSIISDFGITPQNRAVLYWDKNKKVIVIAFTDATNMDAFPIVFIYDNSAFITAGKFFRFLSIPPGKRAGAYKYKTLPAKEVGIADTDANALVVHLKKSAPEPPLPKAQEATPDTPSAGSGSRRTKSAEL